MHNVYLLLGSNLGEREIFLRKARKHILNQIGEIRQESGIYQTASWGNENLPEFFNQVIHVETSLNAKAILARIVSIEKSLGRIRAEKWGSRNIDIDLLFFDNEIIEEPGLTIPHTQLHLRRFTLVPLKELNPHLLHPVLNKTITELLENCSDMLPVLRVN